MEDVTEETVPKPPRRKYYPSMSPQERLAALRQIRGMWKGRDPNPVEYFSKLRETSDRELAPRNT